MRLTCKMEKNGQIGYDIKEKYVDKPNSLSIWASSLEAMTKLGQLEDVEEELGIDLITFFKALNGCWFLQISTKKIFGDIRPTLIYQGGWHLKPNLTELPMIYALKDYGKTWALTKEELRNE